MQVLAEYAAQRYACRREYYVFPAKVGGNFYIVEAQYLDSSKLPYALGHVYVGEVVKHNYGQSRRAEYYHHYYEVHALHAVHIGVLDVGGAGGGGNAVKLQHLLHCGLAGGVGVILKVEYDGVYFGLIAEYILVCRGRKVDKVGDVVLIYARYLGAVAAVTVNGYAVAHIDFQQFAELLIYYHAAFRQGHLIARAYCPGNYEFTYILRVEYFHIGGGRVGGGFRGDAARIYLSVFAYVIRTVQICFYIRMFGIQQPVVQGYLGVVAEYVAILGIHGHHEGITQAKAGDYKPGAAAYAYHGHEEPLLIAEKVAHCDLPVEAERMPYGGYTLQQHTLPGRGRLGAHEVGRGVGKGGNTGPKCGKGGTGHRCNGRPYADSRVEAEAYVRHLVHYLIGDVYHGWEYYVPYNDAEKAAGKAGKQTVAKVFFGYIPPAVA